MQTNNVCSRYELYSGQKFSVTKDVVLNVFWLSVWEGVYLFSESLLTLDLASNF